MVSASGIRHEGGVRMNDDNAAPATISIHSSEEQSRRVFNKKGPVAASFEDPAARFTMRDAM
jgi:hypothetical protein